MSKIVIHTESGSVYELDPEERLVRRVKGNPSKNLPPATWRPFHSYHIGGVLTVFWPDQFCMRTSRIKSVEGLTKEDLDDTLPVSWST